ncbi:hypothetical protein [Streptomyces sp. NBC_01803]|uniref:hypothetical protein n=1 Tax=Streptomyces sp. NBC_01803 TaxID=2975946 RepID=UPI002DD81FC8|nr:hypothetical protein [Streptomyces sp. NBC_01803]WSA44942.1 hypothetical protein OIE51_12425 [Streptomyces sp. NBC_01803]
MNASNVGVIVTVEVDASTVQRGDQLMVGGYLFTVSDMITLAQGAKRLEFTTGESFTMRPPTILWATRRSPARRRGR